MISSGEARYLLAQWVSAELTEIRRDCYYPEVAPMFKDYQSGYRSSGDDPIARQQMLERVGACIKLCRAVNQAVLMKAFMDGGRVGRTVLGVALDDFRRVYSAVLDDSDQPSYSGSSRT